MENKVLIIDFDSTFVQVEALDELAAIALAEHPDSESIVERIRQITNQGMEGKISLSDSLAKRISLLKANKKHIELLIEALKQKITPSFKRNKEFFEKFADNIYIVSSGFKEYITPIVTAFGIKEEHIYANTFKFDESGSINGLDENNLLSKDQGKVIVVSTLGLAGKTVWAVGDGITDYEIKLYGAANKFYAFTENVTRPAVTAHADVVIQSFDEFLYMHDFPRAISYPRNRIKIILLENVHPNGIKMLQQEGYAVEVVKGSLSEDELCEKIKDVAILGLRSKTNVTKKVLDAAERLLSIGCFCIGTNQVDLDYATKKGVCVFNAPYSNTRSVVEQVIGSIIMLMRKVVAKNAMLQQGKWDKSADNCYEIRGKKLGIVGYGNIGSQLSVLAESLGMQVLYYDLTEKLQLGNAKKCETIEELLEQSDIVTLHVDGRKSNANIIGKYEFSKMKNNVIFINLSRGHVVDIDAMVEALNSKKIMGAAVDVFPYEPKNNQEEFISPLRGFDNLILTPHIGWAPIEARQSCVDVSESNINSIIYGNPLNLLN